MFPDHIFLRRVMMARIRNRFRAKMTWIVLLATGLMVATGLAQEPCTNMFPNSNHCTDCQQIEPGGAPAYKCTTQAFSSLCFGPVTGGTTLSFCVETEWNCGGMRREFANVLDCSTGLNQTNGMEPCDRTRPIASIMWFWPSPGLCP